MEGEESTTPVVSQAVCAQESEPVITSGPISVVAREREPSGSVATESRIEMIRVMCKLK